MNGGTNHTQFAAAPRRPDGEPTLPIEPKIPQPEVLAWGDEDCATYGYTRKQVEDLVAEWRKNHIRLHEAWASYAEKMTERARAPNRDPIDVEAGLAELKKCGYHEPKTVEVIAYALRRWGRDEEVAAERMAIDRTFHGIDFTSWRRVLAAAIASAEGARS